MELSSARARAATRGRRSNCLSACILMAAGRVGFSNFYISCYFVIILYYMVSRREGLISHCFFLTDINEKVTGVPIFLICTMWSKFALLSALVGSKHIFQLISLSVSSGVLTSAGMFWKGLTDSLGRHIQQFCS